MMTLPPQQQQKQQHHGSSRPWWASLLFLAGTVLVHYACNYLKYRHCQRSVFHVLLMDKSVMCNMLQHTTKAIETLYEKIMVDALRSFKI